jgi:hypothetical protein
VAVAPAGAFTKIGLPATAGGELGAIPIVDGIEQAGANKMMSRRRKRILVDMRCLRYQQSKSNDG